MSKGIKTKATVKDVKALDKSAVAAERMKQAYIRTKDKAQIGPNGPLCRGLPRAGPDCQTPSRYEMGQMRQSNHKTLQPLP